MKNRFLAVVGPLALGLVACKAEARSIAPAPQALPATPNAVQADMAEGMRSVQAQAVPLALPEIRYYEIADT